MKKGLETRLKIIAEAAPLFNRKGYEGCSMQDIMRATGLKKGGIYRHFDSKEDLAVEAFDFAWNHACAKRRQGMHEADHTIDRLKKAISNFVARPGFPGGCPLLNTAVDSDDGNPILRNHARKALQEWQTVLMGTIEEGIARREIAADAEPRKLANLIIGSLEGALVISRLEQNRNALQMAQEYLERQLEKTRCSK